MPSRFLIWGAGALIAMAAVTAQVRDSRTTSDSGISRRLVIDEKTVQVVRSTYKSGALEPPGHGALFRCRFGSFNRWRYRVEIAGKTVAWKVGEPIFIPRGAEHRLANRGETAVDLVSIRIP